MVGLDLCGLYFQALHLVQVEQLVVGTDRQTETWEPVDGALSTSGWRQLPAQLALMMTSLFSIKAAAVARPSLTRVQ
jgi:hypothetical protein